MRWIGTAVTLVLVATAVALLSASPAQPAAGDIADLGVTKADSPDPVSVGATLTYTIQVTNIGPQGATAVTVTDKLPGHTDFLSATASSGSCQRKGGRVTCSIGNLAADPTKANAVTATIAVRPAKAGTLKNTATVDSAETDPIAANDKADATTTVIVPPVSSCRGVPATLTGTPGADRLVGTEGPDVIAGLGGADEIFGRAGRDLICAGGGNDRANGGAAADRVFGGRGADRLLGRGGPDLLAGNPGNDVLSGGRGNDRLRGGRHNDRLRGGRGFDRCEGGPGLDSERGCER